MVDDVSRDAGDAHEEQPRSTGGPVRAELLMVAELAALVGFAVVSPVLGPFGESPDSFAGVDASPGDVLVFGLLVAFVPVLVVGVVAVASRVFGPSVRGWVQTGLVSVLAAVAVVVVVRKLGLAAPGRVVVAVVVAGGVGWLHRRWEPGRSFLRFASPAPLLFLVLFMFASSATPLLSPEDPGEERASVTPAAGPAPVVMIVLDELPTLSLVEQGEIDADQFPNLARLAATSTWYRNNTTVADHTINAVPALTTGRLPSGSGFATAETYPETIFTLLGRTHDVHAIEWSTQLCPSSLCDGEQPEMDEDAAALVAGPIDDRASPLRELGDEAASLWWDQAAPWAEPPEERFDVVGLDDAVEVARPGLEFLSGLTESDGDRPTFDYGHVPIPHQPWFLLPTGETYNGPLYGELGVDAPEEVLLATKVRHLLQAQWTDRWLGAVIDRLQELDRWDDAVVVVAADHGLSFDAEAPGRDLQLGNEAEVAWAPLLIKSPGQSDGEVNDDNVQTIDVLPTVAELAGVEVPWEVDGMSLAGEAVRADPSKSIRVGDRTGKIHPDAGPDRLVELSTDGLSEILEAAPLPGASDELQLWRHGRHSDLLGREVDDLGECAPGPPASYRPPVGWSELRHDGRRLPLWHEGTVEAEGLGDLAVAVDGTVVGWTVPRPSDGGASFAVLLAAPLIDDSPGTPTLYEIVDRDGCGLRPLPIEE